jgi:hypothetical protein
MNWGLYAVDIVMDVTLSMIYCEGVGNLASRALSKTMQNIISSTVGGIIDGIIDVFQTYAYYLPDAQDRINGTVSGANLTFDLVN